jgi:hypothetical protein
MDIVQLIAQLPKRSLLQSLILFRQREHGPASMEAIHAAELRVGHPLPADYRQLLAVHDGLRRINLMPVGQIMRLQQWPGSHQFAGSIDDPDNAGFALGPEAGATRVKLAPSDLRGCIVVGGSGPGRQPDADWVATQLWCPLSVRAETVFLDVSMSTAYPAFTDYLRERLVKLNADKFDDDHASQ